jgi:UPF0176 protein
MDVVNIAAYKFVDLPEILAWRAPLREHCVAAGLKGTILLAPEGINLFLAGSAAGVDGFLGYLRGDALFRGAFSDLEAKRSLSERQPFRRMLVRIKKEIITMRRPTLRPAGQRAPAVDASTLKRWLDQGRDDAGRPIVLLDTRNRFEVDLGTFENAITLELAHFGEFPEVLGRREASAPFLSDARVVTFCTGGIRCEKAALYLQEEGVADVVQLDGGILKYFEQVGGAHWRGECFVFDDRVALDANLAQTATRQCYACRSVLSAADQSDARYIPGKSCPHCMARSTASDGSDQACSRRI